MVFQQDLTEACRQGRSLFLSVDHGTFERWQHSGRALELTERAGVFAVRALEENVLDVLVARRWIFDEHREAALRFKLDFRKAGLEVRLTGGYNPARTSFSPSGPWDERSDEEEEAYQRWRRALRAIGAIYSDLVVTVVCFDEMPAPQRARELRNGLQRLVKLYGVCKKEKSGDDVDKAAARK